MCDEYNYKELLVIRNKFLCCVPVQDIGLKNLQNNLTWDEQQFLLNQTVNNKLIKNYPIKQSYQKLFLKTLISVLELNSHEIHDSLYQTYCSLLNLKDTNKYSFKHYCVKNEIITLKENKNFISEGTTGLCSWQASLALSDYCLSNSNLLKNKQVLELGAGVGLLGITVALNCQPASIYLSDCHPKVLKILSENVLLNCTNRETIESCANTVTETIRARGDSETIKKRAAFDSLTPSSCDLTQTIVSDSKSSGTKLANCDRLLGVQTIESFGVSDNKHGDDSLTVISKTTTNSSEVYVLDLAWETVEENQCGSLRPDVVLAADVVYDSSVFKPLCNAVNYFLDLNPNCQVYFACTERNPDTLNEFLTLLETNKLIIQEIPSPTSKYFFWSTEIPIRFFLITSSSSS